MQISFVGKGAKLILFFNIFIAGLSLNKAGTYKLHFFISFPEHARKFAVDSDMFTVSLFGRCHVELPSCFTFNR